MRNYWTAILSICVLLVIASCTKVIHRTGSEVQVYMMDKSITNRTDSSIISLINPYKTTLDAEMSAEVGKCVKRLEKTQPESTLGNWMSDAFEEKAEEYFNMPIDFAIQNYGGIRVPYLQKGSISKGNIFELMPFENRIVLLKVKGATVQTLFNHIASLGGWPVSKAVRFEIRDGLAQNIYIEQKALDLNKEYIFALPDYIANGGDKCSFLAAYVDRIDSERLIRDAFLEYINDHPILDADIEGRITIAK